MSGGGNARKVTKARRLSKRVPHGWVRRELVMDGDLEEKLRVALECKLGEGKIVEAALWWDQHENKRKLEVIFENGSLARVKFDLAENADLVEFSPTLKYELRVGRPLRKTDEARA
jgi:hypothetical protein